MKGTEEDIKKLLSEANQEMVAELLAQLLKTKQIATQAQPQSEPQKAFVPVDIDDSVANVTEQEELEGQVTLQEEEVVDSNMEKAELLRKLLKSKKT